jgi:polyisoprenoid-binding protein YceI
MKESRMKSFFRTFAVLLLLLLALPAIAADPYKIDATHSNVSFSIRHIFSQVTGRFTKFKGIVKFDPNYPEQTSVDMAIETASINTDNERRDAHLKGADFFQADSFPAITFKSTKTYKNEKGLFMDGELSMHGVVKSITIPFEVLGTGGEPGKMVAGFASAFKVDRKDFGITWNRAIDQGGMVLGDEVSIHVGVEARFYLE